MVLIAFNKPWGVLSQFTPDGSKNRTLAGFGFPKDVYPLGRLDADSEGLLLLSDEPGLNARLLSPECGHLRTYWAQVDNVPEEKALVRLRKGLVIQGRRTLPCRARLIEPQPEVAARVPPIRFRQNIPACWIEIALTEGRNRQVRKMTAAIGHPTLRLIRVRIGDYQLKALAPGQWKKINHRDRNKIFNHQQRICHEP